MTNIIASGLALALSASAPRAAEPSDAERLLENQLPSLGISRADLRINSSAWDTRMTLPDVEAMLQDPLQTPTMAERWALALRGTKASADLIRWAAKILGDSSKAPAPETTERALRREREIPGPMRPAVEDILQAISRAQPLLDKAVVSLSAEERPRVLAAVASVVAHQDDRRLESADFAAMQKFDRASLLEAARLLAEAADRSIPGLQEGAADLKDFHASRWSTPFGDVVLSGPGDHSYPAETLQNAALLIDAGGDSRYLGPAAAAGEGKIRIVIDLAENVSVESPSPAAGSGIFGIGLFYLPNPKGVKTFRAGDYSLGSGLFGVGGLFVSGSSATFAAGAFSEGAGAFGLGILRSQGDQARYDVRFAGQGFGFTGGAGLFLHSGNDALIKGGIYYPDPREELAGISLSQGVGYGPRALAGGGVGLALIDGSRNNLQSSYFAQGSGYWHGFGGLFLFGDENRLQARRYDQGAGVHTAVGAFLLKGNRNQIVNWGVGPAYGWDSGVGLWWADGDDNRAQADWSAGHGDFNGHSLAVVRGDRNRLLLPDLGTGNAARGAPSFGLALCLGQDNRVKWVLPREGQGPADLRAGPWGVLHLDGRWIFDPTLEPVHPDWPRFDRDPELRRELEIVTRRIQQSQGSSTPERLRERLSIAASFGLDSPSQSRLAESLLALPDRDIPVLAGLLSTDHFEEFVWLRALLAAYGRAGAGAWLSRIPRDEGLAKALAVGSLSLFRAEDAMPALMRESHDPEPRVRRAAAAAMGQLWDRQEGSEPGRVLLLEAITGFLPKKWAPLLRNKRLADLYAVLALDPGFSVQDRAEMLTRCRNPYDTAGEPAVQEFIRIVGRRRAAYRAAAGEELRLLHMLGPQTRDILRRLARDPDPRVVMSALATLGSMGDERDAAFVASFLDNDDGLIRAAAAIALGKMGRQARGVVTPLLGSPSARTRALAAAAISQSMDRHSLARLHQALADGDARVRAVATSVIPRFQEDRRSYRRRFLPDLRRLADRDPDPSVRLSAEGALTAVGR